VILPSLSSLLRMIKALHHSPPIAKKMSIIKTKSKQSLACLKTPVLVCLDSLCAMTNNLQLGPLKDETVNDNMAATITKLKS
jgi:hypothetical protein